MSYPPAYYTDEDLAYARRIMRDHGFALLVSDGLMATQLPLIWKDEGGYGALYGHMSHQNPLAQRLAEGGPLSALAVFTGPHAYVSATVYENPGNSVPTWNYASVQAHGQLSRLAEETAIPHLTELAEIYEGDAGWAVPDAADYVAALKRGIVTLRLEISALQAFRKMSGNKPPAIRKRIIDAARARGEDAFADEMETCLD